ncbi:MAG: hemerythrin domain-containing protein [Alphaproteobacteria bacterium]|nr:hemerythrin domain-containing protein [Alphaproteobacteria bacterium]
MAMVRIRRLEWRPGFSVGIEVIDGQHKTMIDALNSVGEALERGDAEGCVRLYGDFLRLSSDHFAAEELVLFSSGYPKAQEHADHHKRLLEMAELAREQCLKRVLSHQETECFNALLEFLIGDLLEADIQFKSFLEEMDRTTRKKVLLN